MSKILIGPAGSGGSHDKGFKRVKAAGLDALEIAFTYSIWMTKEDARKIHELNKKLNLILSIHVPYYINLNSTEKLKIESSKKRILKCCEIADILGAKYVVFHAGFYQKDSKEKTYENIKQQILKLQQEIKKKNLNIILAPETTGKASQFGDLDELIRLKKETGCHLCVDFSHLKARYAGKIDYDAVMKKLKPLGNLHCHFSGIEFTEKGERRHLITPESEIKTLFSYLKKYDIDCTIINESPDPIGDAIKMKELLK